MTSIIVELVEPLAVSEMLDGKTFQIHVKGPNTLLLYPIEVVVDTRCPIIVGGERCGDKVGHTGKHQCSMYDLIFADRG